MQDTIKRKTELQFYLNYNVAYIVVDREPRELKIMHNVFS